MGFGARRSGSAYPCVAILLCSLPAFAQPAPRGPAPRPTAAGVPVELVSTDPSMHLRLALDLRDRRHIERMRLGYREYPAQVSDDPVPLIRCRGACGARCPRAATSSKRAEGWSGSTGVAATTWCARRASRSIPDPGLDGGSVCRSRCSERRFSEYRCWPEPLPRPAVANWTEDRARTDRWLGDRRRDDTGRLGLVCNFETERLRGAAGSSALSFKTLVTSESHFLTSSARRRRRAAPRTTPIRLSPAISPELTGTT